MEGNVVDLLGVGIALFSITGGLGVAYYSVWLQSKAREMKHRERMAMIEKGLAPPSVMEAAPAAPRTIRSRRNGGVFTICIGIGLAAMMGLGQRDWSGVGVGAFIAMIGVALVVNALMDERSSQPGSKDP